MVEAAAAVAAVAVRLTAVVVAAAAVRAPVLSMCRVNGIRSEVADWLQSAEKTRRFSQPDAMQTDSSRAELVVNSGQPIGSNQMSHSQPPDRRTGRVGEWMGKWTS